MLSSHHDLEVQVRPGGNFSSAWRAFASSALPNHLPLFDLLSFSHSKGKNVPVESGIPGVLENEIVVPHAMVYNRLHSAICSCMNGGPLLHRNIDGVVFKSEQLLVLRIFEPG